MVIEMASKWKQFIRFIIAKTKTKNFYQFQEKFIAFRVQFAAENRNNTINTIAIRKNKTTKCEQ